MKHQGQIASETMSTVMRVVMMKDLVFASGGGKGFGCRRTLGRKAREINPPAGPSWQGSHPCD
jgi:hypothetical protein